MRLWASEAAVTGSLPGDPSSRHPLALRLACRLLPEPCFLPQHLALSAPPPHPIAPQRALCPPSFSIPVPVPKSRALFTAPKDPCGLPRPSHLLRDGGGVRSRASDPRPASTLAKLRLRWASRLRSACPAVSLPKVAQGPGARGQHLAGGGQPRAPPTPVSSSQAERGQDRCGAELSASGWRQGAGDPGSLHPWGARRCCEEKPDSPLPRGASAWPQWASHTLGVPASFQPRPQLLRTPVGPAPPTGAAQPPDPAPRELGCTFPEVPEGRRSRRGRHHCRIFEGCQRSRIWG